MFYDVLRYEGAVYRPPSEAYSLIVQSTIGCSYNKCDFCSAFKAKRYRERPVEDVIKDLETARKYYSRVERIFLADGDAMARAAEEQLAILAAVRRLFPECERVTCYASAGTLLKKTPEELKELRGNGMKMVYLGLESGSDAVLASVNKGVTAEESIKGALKAKEAGMMLSVTAISGLAGQDGWQEHAVKTGEALTAMQPEYIGLLTLDIPQNTALYRRLMSGEFKPLDPTQGVFRETLLLLENLDCEGCIFRTNHASNYLPLGGTLNRDKPAMMARLRSALEGGERLRPDWMRGM